MEQEVKESFLYQLALLKGDPVTMETYTDYYNAATRLRSNVIRELRLKGVTGSVRAVMNDLLNPLVPGFKEYLYAKDPTCQICGVIIDEYKDATLDHIHPKSKGGKSSVDNLQLAHGRCNVLKSDKIGFTLLKVVV